MNPNDNHLNRPFPKQINTALIRKKSLVRPERSKSFRRAISGMETEGLARSASRKSLARAETLRRRALASQRNTEPTIKKTWWVRLSRVLTFYAQPFVISCCCGKKDKINQQAFREKLALCTIILIIMASVAFLTFGFQQTLCGIPPKTFKYNRLYVEVDPAIFSVHGKAYETVNNNGDPYIHPANINISDTTNRDYSFLFPPGSDSVCSQFVDVNNIGEVFQCGVPGVWPPENADSAAASACHSSETSRNALNSLNFAGRVIIDWNQIKSNSLSNTKLVIYNGLVLDVSRYEENSNFLGAELFELVSSNIGNDITLAVASRGLTDRARCLSDIFTIALLDIKTTGCFVTDIVLYVSLIFIGGVVLIRFFLAVVFAIGMGWRLGDRNDEMLKVINGKKMFHKNKQSHVDKQKKMRSRFTPVQPSDTNSAARTANNSHLSMTPSSIPKTVKHISSFDISFMDTSSDTSSTDSDSLMSDPNLMHTLVMVPCYSEGYESIKATLDSIVQTDYPTTHKCIFAIADGIIQGAGNEKPTHEFLIDLMDIDPRFKNEDPKLGGDAKAYSYVAIADGNKRKNYARVYAGWYRIPQTRSKSSLNSLDKQQDTDSLATDQSDITGRRHTIKQRSIGRVPMILVVKVGNEEERMPGKKKAGNRGKRDSQVVLMNFLSKVIFDDRMTELEFDIFYKLFTITGINPEKYEAVMMIDADTKIEPSSLRHLIAAMVKDPNVIGLCGETQVENKWQSFITMIQVFEYFISHHLSKAFESLFGVVTCLPGCFSLYRIRAPKGEGFFVPILANPDIVEEYSENVVDTLHKKNLLLLGEDRYLSTLMLKSFPKRKMIFVPKARCKTVVPDEFKVLLSQRRRWINSTIHNLLELLKVRDLCGTFCFSMQFIVFMELIGTVVLPAAICFTIYVLVLTATTPDTPWATLILLVLILGLPGIFTVIMSRKIEYVFWLLIYLIALPIWNMVLPLYAFWHFDDFSWGETRKTDGDHKGEDHGRRVGEFDGSGISMRRWSEWMAERRDQLEISRTMRNDLAHVKPSMPTLSAQSNPNSLPYSPSVSPVTLPDIADYNPRVSSQINPSSIVSGLPHGLSQSMRAPPIRQVRFVSNSGHPVSIMVQRPPRPTTTTPQTPVNAGIPPMMIRSQTPTGQHIIHTSNLQRQQSPFNQSFNRQ